MALTRISLDIEMADGTVHEDVKVTIADQMLYAKKARMEKWGSMQEDMMSALIFLGFAALYRLGIYTKGFNDFLVDAVVVLPHGAEDGEEILPTKADQ